MILWYIDISVWKYGFCRNVTLVKVFLLQSGFQEGLGDCLQHFKISSFGAKRKEISGECNHF